MTDTSNAATADDVSVLVEARTPLSTTPVGSPTPTPIATQAAIPNRTPTYGSAVVEDMTFTVGQHVEVSPLPQRTKPGTRFNAS